MTRSKETAETVVRARGHENVAATHASTFEVTAEDFLTPAGDCIVGVKADSAPAEFPEPFRAACRDADARITATLEVRDEAGNGDLTETVVGQGHPDLTFEDDTSMVFRTSDYVDDRTVMIESEKAAADLDRAFVSRLAAGADLRVLLRVE